MISIFRRKSRVLVLDDDVSMQKLVSMLLKREGLKVDVVDHGNQAVEAVDRTRYDVILLDLMMPHEGGMTVISHLKEKNPDLLKRVILLTATPKAVLKGIARDVAGVVRKPFKHEELVETVLSVLKS
ncbi:MAG TPA: response regulator [Thermoanaerobaculia bacterium]|nr:response regulator [Thermoanaerobaculia bacterium]